MNAQSERYALLHRSHDQLQQPMLWRQQGLILPQWQAQLVLAFWDPSDPLIYLILQGCSMVFQALLHQGRLAFCDLVWASCGCDASHAPVLSVFGHDLTECEIWS